MAVAASTFTPCPPLPTPTSSFKAFSRSDQPSKLRTSMVVTASTFTPCAPLPTSISPSETFNPSDQPSKLLHVLYNIQASTTTLPQLKQIHAHILRNHLHGQNFLLKRLLDSYISFGDMRHAHQTFEQMADPNIHAWNSILKAYLDGGRCYVALQLYARMLRSGLTPSNFCFPLALKASARLPSLPVGKQIHAHVVKFGAGADVFVASALVDMYAKCGKLTVALQVFDKMPERNVVAWTALVDACAKSGDMDCAQKVFDEMPDKNVFSWTALVSGYTQNGMWEEALEVFRRMQVEGARPDEVAVLSALAACSHVGALELGQWIHDYAKKNGLNMQKVSLCNALIDMYAKCGDINKARIIFDAMVHRSQASWNSMIVGFAIHGHVQESIQFFEGMQKAGFRPNEVSFTGLLHGCSHGGLVDEGTNYFDSMKRDYGVEPNMKHYGCMVDLLGRAGRLGDAYDFVKGMPFKPNYIVWSALLAACRNHGDLELAEHVIGEVNDLEPWSTGNYVMLSNVYAANGQWDHAAGTRAMLREKGIVKLPGCSWIELNNTVHSFIAGDKTHPQRNEVNETLDHLGKMLKIVGDAPCTVTIT
ncbi:pentatricopeptide repeat-containing protein At2g20540-like [Nymphaea colorata]|nr:pentatricopeptide repeat-containing protein At2g20540-like [Nymphaea colorata]